MIITLLILLVITIVVATGIIVQQVRYRRRVIRTSSNLIMGIGRDLRAALENQNAIEIGHQEIVDNYENDFLDMKARLDASYNAAAYDREMRDDAEKKLKMLNDLIDKHAGHCDSILKEYVDAMMGELLPDRLIHNHPMTERCDENNCPTDRFVDGTHVFTDQTVTTYPAEG